MTAPEDRTSYHSENKGRKREQVKWEGTESSICNGARSNEWGTMDVVAEGEPWCLLIMLLVLRSLTLRVCMLGWVSLVRSVRIRSLELLLLLLDRSRILIWRLLRVLILTIELCLGLRVGTLRDVYRAVEKLQA